MTRSPRRPARGFTLTEILIALPIAALILFWVTELCLTAGKMTMKSRGMITTSEDATLALQTVIEQVREAQSFALPGDAAFSSPTGHASDYTTSVTDSNNNQITVYTALKISLPPSVIPQQVGYSQSAGSNITVYKGDGTSVALTSASGLAPVSKAQASTLSILFYRGTATGAPNPSGGQYLWERSLEDNGATVNRILCSTIATQSDSGNAVQFLRPYDTSNTVIPNEVDIKLVSSAYSPYNKDVSNEQTNGLLTTSLIGKSVVLRDAATGATSAPTNSGGAQPQNGFIPQ